MQLSSDTLAALGRHAHELMRLAAALGWTHIIIALDPEPEDTAELLFRVALSQEGEPAVDPPTETA